MKGLIGCMTQGTSREVEIRVAIYSLNKKSIVKVSGWFIRWLGLVVMLVERLYNKLLLLIYY